MSLTIERAAAATPEVHDLYRRTERTCFGAAYDDHQRHGLSIEQIFKPNVRFFVARLDGCRRRVRRCRDCLTSTPRSNGCTRGQRYAVGEFAKALLRRDPRMRRVGADKPVLRLETGIHQQEASGLYRRMGFRPRGPFGPYAAMPTHNIETSLFFREAASVGRSIRPKPSRLRPNLRSRRNPPSRRGAARHIEIAENTLQAIESQKAK